MKLLLLFSFLLSFNSLASRGELTESYKDVIQKESIKEEFYQDLVLSYARSKVWNDLKISGDLESNEIRYLNEGLRFSFRTSISKCTSRLNRKLLSWAAQSNGSKVAQKDITTGCKEALQSAVNQFFNHHGDSVARSIVNSANMAVAESEIIEKGYTVER